MIVSCISIKLKGINIMLTSLETKVLIIENDQDFLNIAVEKLSARGFTVLTASTGKEGIEILKKENVEAILLDFNNANRNGVVVINYINSLEKKPILLPLQNHAKTYSESVAPRILQEF